VYGIPHENPGNVPMRRTQLAVIIEHTFIIWLPAQETRGLDSSEGAATMNGGIMSLALLDAHETAEGLAVTFITDYGLEQLEGSCEEVARLAEVMHQISALAPLNETDSVWLEEVVVGDATVKLGLNPGGLTRMLIERA